MDVTEYLSDVDLKVNLVFTFSSKATPVSESRWSFLGELQGLFFTPF